MSKKSYSILAVALAGSMSLAACGGGSSDKGSDSSSGSGGGKGGTLYYLTAKSGVENLDPQRVYIGRDINNWGRLWSRSLVQMPVTEDKSAAVKPVADLATDTGTSKNGGKEWSFTLKSGVKWQDGKEVTCEDVKYGVSRTFAVDQITGGPAYALTMLDLPQKDGQPLYDGPYKNDHKADFDKAVSCSGKTITYKFNKAFPDFPLAIAQLRAFDPVRKDKDQGPKSNFMAFSNGPYKLQGDWKQGQNNAGTFVRNDQWDSKTDGVRKALPDKIVFREGLEASTLAGEMISDSGEAKTAVTADNIPPEKYAQITGKVKDRSNNVLSPFVDYLVPNMKKMTNPKVRQALLAATAQQDWMTAGGGDKRYAPAYSVINEAITSAYVKNPSFKYGLKGDTEAAKKLLQEAGQPNPAITFTYRAGTPTADKMAAALQNAWQKAGFKVTLNGIDKDYYSIIRKPNAEGDVFWAGWGPDWSSASTVIPPLFDSRMNITSNSNGSDYGAYKSDDVNKMIDEAGKQTTVDAAGAIYKKIDAKLGEDVAYIPLEASKFFTLRGSNVTGYINNPAMSMYPDLGSVGVK